MQNIMVVDGEMDVEGEMENEGARQKISYVDLDTVGSALIWVRGSRSRGIKLRENQSLTNRFLEFLS